MYKSPFRGRYLIRNWKANLSMYALDTALAFMRLLSKRHFNITKPQKILICNISHIGDVVMTTSLLPVIHNALPNCKIGMVVGSCARGVVEHQVDHLHLYDHWKVARKKPNRSPWKEVQRVGYDISIDCNYYFPNCHLLTFKAKIPTRIGYTSGGLGPLLTHPVPYVNKLQSASEHFADLLSLVTPIDRSLLQPTLSFQKKEGEPYSVIHMGSGNPIKEWPLENWRALIQKLEGPLIFTGRGEKENAHIQEVTRGLKQCVNLCNQLTLEQCVEVIAGAKLLVGVDTGVGHIAAATKTPSVLIYSGINPIEHWSPKSSLAQVLIHKPNCYPCYQMRGCKSMDCVRKVHVDQVLERIDATLHQRKESGHQSLDHSVASPYAAHEN